LEVAVLTCGQCPHNNYIFCKFYLCLHEETHAEPTQKFYHLYLRTKIKISARLVSAERDMLNSTTPSHVLALKLKFNQE